jgi:hypothetical protein
VAAAVSWLVLTFLLPLAIIRGRKREATFTAWFGSARATTAAAPAPPASSGTAGPPAVTPTPAAPPGPALAGGAPPGGA